jgi:hypothetical protein
MGGTGLEHLYLAYYLHDFLLLAWIAEPAAFLLHNPLLPLGNHFFNQPNKVHPSLGELYFWLFPPH